MALVMGAAYPGLYAAVGVHSGLPYQSANDVMSALNAMRSGAADVRPQPDIRTIVFHGDADSTVHPANADSIAHSRRKPARKTVSQGQAAVPGGRRYTRTLAHASEDGAAAIELWMIKGAGHAWAGGSAEGSYTDPRGPDASAEMLRFFLAEDAG
jgi:poly(3-hydroxybutyrate) depolymerase